MGNRTCSVEGCAGKVTARGYCGRHYQLWWAYGTPVPVHPPKAVRVCSVDGCTGRHSARGYCGKHYQRLLATGSTDDKPRVKPICAVDGCAEFAIARGWCPDHYRHWKTYGDPLGQRKPRTRARCSHGNCGRPAKGEGLCELHLRRKHKGADLDAPLKGIPRPCSEAGCDERAAALGLCDLHYRDQHVKPKYAIYNQRRRDRWAAKSPAERQQCRAENYRTNRQRIRAAAKRRYAERYPVDPSPWRGAKSRRKMRGGRQMTAEDIAISVCYRQAIRNDPCFYCGGRSSEMHDDHYFPLAKRGTDHWFNLVRACQMCNLSKHARCGTWFLLKTGATVEPGRLPALTEAD